MLKRISQEIYVTDLIDLYMLSYDYTRGTLQGTIWTRIIFEVRQVEHMVSTLSIVEKLLLKCGIDLPQGPMNNN